ncbi:hypothetical protein HYH02_006373 [Chlamydomonas schloesseri]|uniref:Uncharacterized protein n=2 Tax=Chlamydomonas schloesseri TaxID=2026947 RepID=A0A835WJB8_9CHLO|nr:hypothetical protein HYH02_006373 [Chlamydomonas schloesseri]|eukprot:KAG2448481.1 hypothetical protein HYH02_006373 [Chlamydomonas schloesseri]
MDGNGTALSPTANATSSSSSGSGISTAYCRLELAFAGELSTITLMQVASSRPDIGPRLVNATAAAYQLVTPFRVFAAVSSGSSSGSGSGSGSSSGSGSGSNSGSVGWPGCDVLQGAASSALMRALGNSTGAISTACALDSAPSTVSSATGSTGCVASGNATAISDCADTAAQQYGWLNVTLSYTPAAWAAAAPYSAVLAAQAGVLVAALREEGMDISSVGLCSVATAPPHVRTRVVLALAPIASNSTNSTSPGGGSACVPLTAAALSRFQEEAEAVAAPLNLNPAPPSILNLNLGLDFPPPPPPGGKTQQQQDPAPGEPLHSAVGDGDASTAIGNATLVSTGGSSSSSSSSKKGGGIPAWVWVVVAAGAVLMLTGCFVLGGFVRRQHGRRQYRQDRAATSAEVVAAAAGGNMVVALPATDPGDREMALAAAAAAAAATGPAASGAEPRRSRLQLSAAARGGAGVSASGASFSGVVMAAAGTGSGGASPSAALAAAGGQDRSVNPRRSSIASVGDIEASVHGGSGASLRGGASRRVSIAAAGDEDSPRSLLLAKSVKRVASIHGGGRSHVDLAGGIYVGAFGGGDDSGDVAAAATAGPAAGSGSLPLPLGLHAGGDYELEEQRLTTAGAASRGPSRMPSFSEAGAGAPGPNLHLDPATAGAAAALGARSRRASSVRRGSSFYQLAAAPVVSASGVAAAAPLPLSSARSRRASMPTMMGDDLLVMAAAGRGAGARGGDALIAAAAAAAAGAGSVGGGRGGGDMDAQRPSGGGAAARRRFSAVTFASGTQPFLPRRAVGSVTGEAYGLGNAHDDRAGDAGAPPAVFATASGIPLQPPAKPSGGPLIISSSRAAFLSLGALRSDGHSRLSRGDLATAAAAAGGGVSVGGMVAAGDASAHGGAGAGVGSRAGSRSIRRPAWAGPGDARESHAGGDGGTVLSASQVMIDTQTMALGHGSGLAGAEPGGPSPFATTSLTPSATTTQTSHSLTGVAVAPGAAAAAAGRATLDSTSANRPRWASLMGTAATGPLSSNFSRSRFSVAQVPLEGAAPASAAASAPDAAGSRHRSRSTDAAGWPTLGGATPHARLREVLAGAGIAPGANAPAHEAGAALPAAAAAGAFAVSGGVAESPEASGSIDVPRDSNDGGGGNAAGGNKRSSLAGALGRSITMGLSRSRRASFTALSHMISGSFRRAPATAAIVPDNTIRVRPAGGDGAAGSGAIGQPATDLGGLRSQPIYVALPSGGLPSDPDAGGAASAPLLRLAAAGGSAATPRVMAAASPLASVLSGSPSRAVSGAGSAVSSTSVPQLQVLRSPSFGGGSAVAPVNPGGASTGAAAFGSPAASIGAIPSPREAAGLDGAGAERELQPPLAPPPLAPEPDQPPPYMVMPAARRAGPAPPSAAPSLTLGPALPAGASGTLDEDDGLEREFMMESLLPPPPSSSGNAGPLSTLMTTTNNNVEELAAAMASAGGSGAGSGAASTAAGAAAWGVRRLVPLSGKSGRGGAGAAGLGAGGGSDASGGGSARAGGAGAAGAADGNLVRGFSSLLDSNPGRAVPAGGRPVGMPALRDNPLAHQQASSSLLMSDLDGSATAAVAAGAAVSASNAAVSSANAEAPGALAPMVLQSASSSLFSLGGGLSSTAGGGAAPGAAVERSPRVPPPAATPDTDRGTPLLVSYQKLEELTNDLLLVPRLHSQSAQQQHQHQQQKQQAPPSPQQPRQAGAVPQLQSRQSIKVPRLNVAPSSQSVGDTSGPPTSASFTGLSSVLYGDAAAAPPPTSARPVSPIGTLGFASPPARKPPPAVPVPDASSSPAVIAVEAQLDAADAPVTASASAKPVAAAAKPDAAAAAATEDDWEPPGWSPSEELERQRQRLAAQRQRLGQQKERLAQRQQHVQQQQQQ